MELRQLRYFVAVAEEGNISRAARKIFLTQPALSRQIKALEDEKGQCLLERQAHSIRLTPVGELLVREARELLQHADQVLDRGRAAGRGVRLRVGYAPSLAAGMLSATVENFVQTHPNARVELFDLSTAEMLAGLEGDKLDVAVTVGQQRETRGLKWTSLLRATWELAVNRNHPLALRPRVTPAEVAGEALLVFCKRDYREYWDIITSEAGIAAFCRGYSGHRFASTKQAVAMDNGLLSCADLKAAQRISARLSHRQIEAFFRKWLARLPHPFSAQDRRAGYRYDLSVLQAEFSLTQVWDRPVHGRCFFEEVIRENIDLGRPEQVQLIFARKMQRKTATDGRCRTRIITEGVVPSLHVYYKNTHLKQYYKEGRGLRTETTINNTYDFGVGRRLKNLAALRQIGMAANRRVLEVERLTCSATTPRTSDSTSPPG